MGWHRSVGVAARARLHGRHCCRRKLPHLTRSNVQRKPTGFSEGEGQGEKESKRERERAIERERERDVSEHLLGRHLRAHLPRGHLRGNRRVSAAFSFRVASAVGE